MGSRKRVHLIALLSLTIALGMAVFPGPKLGAIHSTIPRPVSLADPFVTPTGVYFDHVVIIMMENEGVFDICHGSPPPCNGTPSNATFLAGLANNYTIGSQYTSLVTTSQPNYVAMISGSMQGCTSAGCPSPITAPNLVDRFESVGLSWKAYQENMTGATPGSCSAALNDGEPYTPIHNPFIVFQDITNNTARCNKIVNANPNNNCSAAIDCVLVNDLNNATAAAPNFMFLTPNDCHDMRGWAGCGTSQLIGPGDAYLRKLVPAILNSRTFTTTRSALLITFDEGNGFCPGPNPPSEDCVYASWSGPVAKTKFGTGNLYSHYSVTKTIETNWNLTGFTLNDMNTNSMAEFFKSQPANYNLYASPETMITPQGVSANSTITVTSYNNFTGTVNLSATSSPSGPSLTLNPTSVTLTKQGSATSKLSLQTSTVGNYTITLRATSGSLTHTNTILVQVVPPDFSMSANPSTLTIGQASIALGSTVNATVTGDRTAFESSYLRYSFYANGRIWLFYEDSRFQCEHETGCLSYTSSTNGTSWASPTRTTVHITDNDFSAYTNGTSIFYVRYNETSADSTCGKKIMFGLGTLNPTGSITWQPEQTVATGAANRAYPEDEIVVDSNGQVWIAYMMDYKTSCGNAVSSQRPWVLHSVGTNYASWTGNTTLCTSSCSSRIYHIGLASLGNGQVYGLYWTSRSGTGLHGRIFNGTGTSGWANEETISIDSADVNAWLFNNGSNLYAIYFDNNTETFNFASRSAKGSWTVSTIAVGETHTGTIDFSGSYYALPDTASYDAADNLFTLFYLNGTSQRIDQWTGSGTVWTKNTGIITTPPASYPDSISSFVQSTPSFVGQLYYITGTTRFTINSVRLSFAPASNLASFTTTITAGLGFSATVTLTTTISPGSGLAMACVPSTIPGGSGTSTCNLTASISGNYNVTVTGTSSSLVHSTIVTVRVLTFPDFTITSSTPAPVDTDQSSSTTMTLSAISGFSGTVTLSDSVPSGLSCTPINPASVSLPPTSTATLSCIAPTANNYNVTITGTSGTLSHSTIVTFKFQDFSITASTPAPGNVGTSQTSTISIDGLNSFSGTVSITDAVPNGLSCGSITPTTVSGSGTATVSCNSNSAGTYTLALNGSSNPLSHSTNVTFTFQDFTIIASSPNPADANQQANSTIRINSLNGFSGSVSLTETIPSGLSCSTITPSAVTGSGNATVSCIATLAGNYTLTVFGTSGSLQHNTTVLLQFQDFTILASTPSPVEINGATNSTINAASLDRFAGTINLSITSQTGLSCGPVLPGSLVGSGSASLYCRAGVAGNYNVNVTGISGPLIHTASFVVQVTDFSMNAASYQIVSPAGSNSSLTLNLASLNGYKGNVTLIDSAEGYSLTPVNGGGAGGGTRSLRLSPPSLTPTVVFSPSTINLNGNGASTMTFIFGSARAGNYSITVTTTDGRVFHQVQFTIVVMDFQINSIVGSLSTTQGTNSTLTIGLQGLNGFQGNITMSTTTSPTGPIAALSPSLLHLTVEGNSTLLTISIPSSTTPGNYTVTITAVSGAIVHTFTINFSVSSPGLTTILAGAISSNKFLALGIVGSFSLVLIFPTRRMQQRSRRQERTARYPVMDHRHSRRSPPRFSAILPIYGACLKDEYD